MRNKNAIFFSVFAAALALLANFNVTAAQSTFITSVDVMKYTKDTVHNQPSNSQISAIVSDIMQNIHPQYIAISVPLDESSVYPADSKPYPNSAAAFTQAWADAIHSHGAKVIFRGTWCGIEGIYNFPKLAGAARFPAGTATSALTDGNSTWLGKTYNYILSHPTFFAAGDMWAVLPERTEGIFSDSTSFLSYAAPGIQTNYVSFFTNLDKVSAAAFAKIGKSVQVGLSSNNFSEIASGWMLPQLYTSQPYVSVDYYGTNHTVSEMDTNLRAAYQRYGKPIFLQEWGDYWNANLSQADRQNYLNSMYAEFSKLAADHVLAGFNYWGGWVNNAEGVLTNANGVYGVNYRGTTLAKFFAQFGAAPAMTTQTTSAATTPTISTSPSSATNTSSATTSTTPTTSKHGRAIGFYRNATLASADTADTAAVAHTESAGRALWSNFAIQAFFFIGCALFLFGMVLVARELLG